MFLHPGFEVVFSAEEFKSISFLFLLFIYFGYGLNYFTVYFNNNKWKQGREKS